MLYMSFFFFSSRRRHTRWNCDWSSDVCSSDLHLQYEPDLRRDGGRPQPPAEEEGGEEPGQDVHPGEVGQLKRPEEHACVLGLPPCDYLAVGLGDVEGDPLEFGQGADEEDDGAEGLEDDVPDAGLGVDDGDKVQGAREYDGPDERENQRDFIR